jgi:hypothetical protein
VTQVASYEENVVSSEMLIADKYLSIVNSKGKARKPLSRVYHNMRQTGLFLKAYANLYSNAGKPRGYEIRSQHSLAAGL